jgi:N-acetylmuramoyl-L-alanine amidase
MTPQQAERSGDTVCGAQTALQQHGLYKGRVDGLWGPMTQRAVTSYRGQNSLPATGQLDQATLQASNVTPAAFGVVSE